ncbi:MAG: ABC transporter permease [Sandaracinaceae bacterium]|nr:ABC transporter permease [Sandaracinaceae bacterium]
MWRYLTVRSLRAFATVVGVVTLVFLLVRLVPGDPVDAILGDQASPEERAALRESLHLDAPLPQQYAHFVGDVLDGSLGHSFRNPARSVGSLIAEVLPATAALAFAALALAFGIALPLGVIAAARRGTAADALASTVAVLGLAIPNIWLGPLLILAFAVELRWLPLPGDDALGLEGLLLPAITLGTALAAILTRQTRASMLDVYQEQYVLAARARGLAEWQVATKHVLRNALLPVLTIGAAQLGALLSGAVVTEKVFERAGLGQLFLDAFFARDMPVVQGCVLVVAITYVVLNIAVDLLYVVADPRVRLT